MTNGIFVQVAGFTDIERHALNTLFRLSQGRAVRFDLWMPGAPQAPRLVLLDGDSYESRFVLETLNLTAETRLLWVAKDTSKGVPAAAHAFFSRPVDWPQVVQVLDDWFPSAALDLDLDFSATSPVELQQRTGGPRALIVSGDTQTTLYLHAKLSLAGLTWVDEATDGQLALQLMHLQAYELLVLDLDTAQFAGWGFLQKLRASVTGLYPRAINTVLLTNRVRLRDRIKARKLGIRAIFENPPHPGEFGQLLRCL